MKKAIIFDCDNTLWKGVVGEEEIQHDTELQQDIIFLAKRGVIIGLCSKNNEEDVTEAMKDQLLTDEYISVKRINWKDKVSNLKEIAQELNIGLDAMVFVDDSEFERELVKKQLPEVMTIIPKDLMTIVLDNFDLRGDFTKTQQYKDNYQRAKAKEQFSDINDYLASLDMVLAIKVNDVSQIARITELTQKTNQFNLTTKRYTEDLILHAMKYPSMVFSMSVRDKFGDNGLTGVCIVRGTSIDLFLLSCRILGRKLEYAFMDYIINYLKDNHYQVLIGTYIESPKNSQTKDFYSNCGFECINTTGQIITFVLPFINYKPIGEKYICYAE